MVNTINPLNTIVLSAMLISTIREPKTFKSLELKNNAKNFQMFKTFNYFGNDNFSMDILQEKRPIFGQKRN